MPLHSLRRSSAPSAPPPRQSYADRARRVFAHQGIVLATHQVPTLICCCLVICSLLSPSLLLYFAPDGPTSAIALRGRGELMWELEGMKTQGVVWSEDTVCWDRLAAYYESRDIGRRVRVVRMEQVLVAPSSKTGSGALSKRTLHQTLQLQRELERRLLEGDVPGLTCVRDGAGRCAISSPASWWDSEAALLADGDVHSTLSLPSSATSGRTDLSLPLTVTNTLVGVGRDVRGTVMGAQFLALSFYLEDTSAEGVLKGIGSWTEESARERAKAAWRKTVSDAVASKGWPGPGVEKMGETREAKTPGRRIILKHLPHIPLHANPRLFEDVLFAIGYAVVGLYVVAKTRGTNQVHSKLGLTMTGVVELLLSGIMSLSVSWLTSLPIGLVPWKLIPFLVLVCGVDNMFVLTEAIGGTDIGLPVPERVAAGLASVGLSTTVTLLTELSLASFLLWVLSVQVFREIIIFTCVVLVVDYFMGIYFFSTILSIDIQRLELADLLSQGSRPQRQGPPSPSADLHNDLPGIAPDGFSSLVAAVKGSLRARAARTATFGFLFFINVLLYSLYGPDHYLPAFCSETALAQERPLLSPSLSTEFVGSIMRGRAGRETDIAKGAGEAFWRLINPANSSSVHVYVEPLTIVKFYDDGLVAPESAGTAIVGQSWAVSLGLIISPIAATTLILYFILLYLLKDAELLAVQRSNFVKERTEKKAKTVGASVNVTALRGRHASDVEVMASSRDKVASWAGLDDQVVIWSKSDAGFTPTHLEIPITAEPASLILLALDGDSRFCAAATLTGRILVWALDRKLLIDFSLPDPSFMATIGLANHLFSSPLRARGTPAPPGSLSRPAQYGFFSTHQNGAVVLWDCTSYRASIVLPPVPATGGAKFRNIIVSATQQSASPVWPIYARVHAKGRLEIFRSEGGVAWDVWTSVFDDPEATSATDAITSLAFGEFSIGGPGHPARAVLVVGTLTGLVSLYDLEEGTRLATITQMSGAVRQIRLSPASKSKCTTCGETLSDGIFVVCSTRPALSVLRVYSSGCTCSASLRRSLSSISLTRSTSSGSVRTPKKRRPSHGRPASAENSTYSSPRNGRIPGGSVGGTDRPRRVEASDTAAPAAAPDADEDTDGIEDLDEKHPLLTPPPTIESPPPPGSDESGSPTVSDVPLFESSGERLQPLLGQDGDSIESSGWGDLHVQQAAATATDERGGWDVVAHRIIGVRRRRATKEEREARASTGEGPGPTSWEVWSMPTTDPGPSGSILEEGATSLDRLLSGGPREDQRIPPASSPTSSSLSAESLRHRVGSPPASSLSPIRARSAAPPPSIRFEDVDLPFSRARPVITALGDGAVAVGLGNSVAIIAPRPSVMIKLRPGMSPPRRRGPGGSG